MEYRAEIRHCFEDYIKPVEEKFKFHPNKGIPFTLENIEKEFLFNHIKGRDRGIFKMDEGVGKEVYSKIRNGDRSYLPMKLTPKTDSSWSDSILTLNFRKFHFS